MDHEISGKKAPDKIYSPIQAITQNDGLHINQPLENQIQ